MSLPKYPDKSVMVVYYKNGVPLPMQHLNNSSGINCISNKKWCLTPTPNGTINLQYKKLSI